MPRIRRTSSSSLVREKLAQEAARLMIDQGIRDFSIAKRKAAKRLGVHGRRILPSNRQIEQRLIERQRIFEGSDHPNRIRALRIVALRVMDALAEYEPRLVGSVLAGTAIRNAVIELHVFSDTLEPIAELLENRVGHARIVERRCRMTKSGYRLVPGLRLTLEGHDVLVQVFPLAGQRQAPLSPVDLRPMKRARRADVVALIDA